MTSFHYTDERAEREQNIRKIGYGNPICVVEIDRGHRNGPELHEVTDTGIVNIYNKRTGKLITKLIARPGQLKRYFENGKVPQKLYKKAVDNTVYHCYNLV